MTTLTLAGRDVSVDEGGFFTDPSSWTPEMAEEMARAEGITLTDRHWEVLNLMRRDYEANGTGPNVRALSKKSGIPIKELYQLFPKGPAKTAARLAGIPKPQGCI
ncbi:MAG: TusE/DsrC/DsvC family sulfur relay protein [Actinomyces sp.]|nr:MAG: TusE/DsrC/DsvC family sulfur relay protein [Actinomyces sp.]